MLPLLVKDGLVIAYASSTLIFLAIGLYYYSSTRVTNDQQVTFWPTLPFPGLSKLAVSPLASNPSGLRPLS